MNRKLSLFLGMLGVIFFIFGASSIVTILTELFAFNYIISDAQRNLEFLAGLSLFAVGLFMMNEFRKPSPRSRPDFERIIGLLLLIFGGFLLLNTVNDVFYYVYKSSHNPLLFNANTVWNYSVETFFLFGFGIWLIMKGKEYH